MADNKKLYQTLGIDPSASQQEIESAYQHLIAKYNQSDPEYDMLVQAYTVLSNMETRAMYDVTGKVRNRHTRSNPLNKEKKEKVRYTLNTLFLAGAAVTTILFILQWSGMSTTPFYCACVISILIKLSEYLIRLLP